MEKKTLFNIVKDSQEIIEQIIEAGGELTPELEAQLSQVDLTLAEKVDSYNHVLERLKLEQDYWKKKADQMKSIEKSCKLAQERLKDSLKFAMKQMGETEIKGGDYRFKLVNSKPSVIVDNLGELPHEFRREKITIEPDKDALRAALEQGEVQGAHLEESSHVRAYVNKSN